MPETPAACCWPAPAARLPLDPAAGCLPYLALLSIPNLGEVLGLGLSKLACDCGWTGRECALLCTVVTEAAVGGSTPLPFLLRS